jgi:hypothetical protein
MQKVDGVEKVRVSLQLGVTVLDLKPNNAVTLGQLRQIVRNNGFVSKDVAVTAAGEPATIDGKPAFMVSGTGERLQATAQPQRSGGVWTFTVPAPR